MRKPWTAYFRKHRVRITDAHRARLSALVEAQRGVCGCGCGARMDNSRRAQQCGLPDRATIDHVWPHAANGLDGPGNLLAMRSRCNSAKAHSLPTDHQLAELERVNRVLGWAPVTTQRSAA